MMKEKKDDLKNEELVFNSQKFDKPFFSSNHNNIEPFVMTIEIDQGRTQKIFVYPNSDPEEISYEFCKNNNLDFSSLKYLKQEIQDLLLKFKENILVNKLGECINEVIHEEDENNSLSNQEMFIKNTSRDKSKSESERENKFIEKKVANTEVSKETLKASNTYLNSLCLTTENNFDIIADLKAKSSNEKQVSKLYTTKTDSKKSNSNVYDKLYQDSRLRRIMSPNKSSSNSQIRTNISPQKLRNLVSELRPRKSSLLNQLIHKKLNDDQSLKNIHTSYLTQTNKKGSLIKKNNSYFSPNKSKSSKSSLVKSLKSFSISENNLTKNLFNSPKNDIKSPKPKEKTLTPSQMKNYFNSPIVTNLSPHNKTTQDLFTKLKFKQFTNIFKLLDQDEDGLITHYNNSNINIPIQIKKILKPIFEKMEEEMKNYNLQDFLEECDEVFKKSSYLEKKILINFNKFYDKKKNSISISNYVTNVLEKLHKTRNNIMTYQNTSNNDSKFNSKSLISSNMTNHQQSTKILKTESNSNSMKYNNYI